MIRIESWQLQTLEASSSRIAPQGVASMVSLAGSSCTGAPFDVGAKCGDGSFKGILF